MEERKKRRSDTIDKIDAQITRIENIINDLMVDIDIAEMSAYERLTMVHKFLGQHQKSLEMLQTCIIDEPEKRESIMLNALVSRMREVSRPEIEEDGNSGSSEL